jgi:hypothetical protein
MSDSEYAVVVLSDGETYSDAKGCVILHIPNDVEDVGNYIRNNLHSAIEIAPTVKRVTS